MALSSRLIGVHTVLGAFVAGILFGLAEPSSTLFEVENLRH